MTQKELLYLEDACMHEQVLLEVLNESKNNVEDDSFIEFFDNQISIHQDMLDDLKNLLEDKKDER